MQGTTRRVGTIWGTLGLLLLAGCGESAGPGGGGGEKAALSGTVREAGVATPLADVTVTLGTSQTASDGTGHFEFTDLPVGAASLRAERPGYLSVTVNLVLAAGDNSHDVGLERQEIYRVGDQAVFVPRGDTPLRGAIIILGGPVTSGFITGDSLTPGANKPALEQSLQDLGVSLRGLASSQRVALLGSRTVSWPDGAGTDNTLLAALSSAGTESGHSELGDAPLLMFGLSAGARESAGLAARLPGRAIGLLVRVPAGITSLSGPEALAVPTFVMQAQQDVAVDNLSIRAVFASHRAQGGLWALAVEPGIGHDVATASGNLATISWLNEVLERRLPSVAGSPLIPLSESAGWLGDQNTLVTAPWATYAGNRSEASWLLSETQATSWKELGTVPDTSGGGQ